MEKEISDQSSSNKDGISMNCERCGTELREEDIIVYQNKHLCEDCCFDLMNPPKTCDPTAVSSTLNVRKELGQTGNRRFKRGAEENL
jgi:hypothetical protein